MQIDAKQRLVTLSVGEFAAFTPYPTPGFGGPSALWRAQLGTDWHQRIQKESAASGEGMDNEVPIQGELKWRHWTLNLAGRIDQMKRLPLQREPSATELHEVPKESTTSFRNLTKKSYPSSLGRNSIHLREIKTVSEPLPLEASSILERYPSYPIQLLAYRELLMRGESAAKRATDSDVEEGQESGLKLPSIPYSECEYILELLFIEIGSGITQSLSLDESYDALLVDQLDRFTDYLESQRERLDRLRSLTIKPVYDRPRPGQENIQEKLAEAMERSNVALLEAATGFGKTGVAWEHAARRLASGQCDRILYLTSKATGQIEAVNRLTALLEKSRPHESTERAGPASSASFWHIRNKQEHCIHIEFRCSRQTCPYLNQLHEKWKQSGLQRLYLLTDSQLDLESLKAEGRSTGICPYEIMRAALDHRDIWIGDYNYLFSPASSRLLSEQADFDPNRTFLVIDEAHNLPSRVQSAFSFSFSTFATYAALDDLEFNKAPAAMRQHLKELANALASLSHSSEEGASRKPGRSYRNATLFDVSSGSPSRRFAKDSPVSEREGFAEADFLHNLSKVADCLLSEALPYEELNPETLDFLFTVSAAHAARQRDELTHQLWAPEDGSLKMECIDASRLIASKLAQFNKTLFLSATLSPLDSFLDDVGLGDWKVENLDDASTTAASERAEPLRHVIHLTPPAPWRESAYDVAIDLRVDTRFKSRRIHIDTTAVTIANAAESSGPIIAFFPSYAYAQQAYEALQLQHPMLRVALQPRAGGGLSERSAYLEESLAFNDCLLLILGSSFAEGVDTLGGKVNLAIIVSPALPEMNSIQEAKRRHFDERGEKGFERAYVHPGMQKVNQALGRLARSPEHKVKALLHCQRFAEPQSHRLLDTAYRTKTYIHSDEDFKAWLSADS